MADYDFSVLSPADFEDLVRDLLREEFKIHVESFGPGKDGGIDLRFATDGGSTIVQAKRYSESSKPKLIPNLQKDAPRIAALNPARYMVATSLDLTDTDKSKILAALNPLPIKTGDIIGRKDLNALIQAHPSVERAHFKLWLHSTTILERILHATTYTRSLGELDQIKRKIKVFVQNDSIAKGLAILNNHHSVIISGAPGVGKTTLARMILLLHLERGWELLVVNNFEEALAVFNPGRDQIFLFDDVLGRSRLTTDYLGKIDQALVNFVDRARHSKNTRLVMTTREYIYRQAVMQSDRIDSPDVLVTKVVLDVGSYTTIIRAKILYNHIYFSELPKEAKVSYLKAGLYRKVIDHKNFNPRLIETLTNANFFDGVDLDGYPNLVLQTLDNPELIWEKAYTNDISPSARALLAAIHFSSGDVAFAATRSRFEVMYPWAVEGQVKPDTKAFLAAVQELEGSFLTVERTSVFGRVSETISFANPSVGDFLEKAFTKTNLVAHILEKFVFADQAVEAWRFAMRNAGTCPSVSQLAALLPSAATRLAQLPQKIKFETDDGKVPDKNDVLLPDRLNTVLEWAKLLDDDTLWKAASDLTNAVTSSISSGVSSAMPALEFLETQIQSLHPSTTAIKNELKTFVLETLAGEERFFSVAEVTTVSRALESGVFEVADQKNVIVTALETILKNLTDELHDIGSIDELDTYETELVEALEAHGIDTSEALTEFEFRRSVLQDEIYDNDDVEYYQATKGVGSDVETQIASLFAGLATDD